MDPQYQYAPQQTPLYHPPVHLQGHPFDGPSHYLPAPSPAQSGKPVKLIACLLVALAVTGTALFLFLGGSEGSSKTKTLDGRIAVKNGMVTVFAQGKSVHLMASEQITAAELAALEVTGQTIRVTYRGDELISAKAAPLAGKHTSRPGLIATATDSQITLEVDGTRETFIVEPQYVTAMSIPHLRDHGRLGTKVVISYDTRADGSKLARAYKDA